MEGLGDFLELEVVVREDQTDSDGDRIAQGVMQRLGVKPEDLLRGTYLALLKPRDG